MIKFIAAYFILINTISFAMMGEDKKRSKKRNERRISERSLLTSAAIGGSIGSLIGMNFFRHKTKHAKFRIGIPAIIFIQAAAIIYFSNIIKW